MPKFKRANQYPLTQQQKEAIRYHRLYQGGQMNDLKYVLLRDMQSFAVYMGAFNIEKGLYSFLTVHELAVFGYAFCMEQKCPQSAAQFASKLSGRGEDPEHPTLTEKEALLQDFAAALSRDFHHVPKELYTRMSDTYKESEIVHLLSYAGQLLASCFAETTMMTED